MFDLVYDKWPEILEKLKKEHDLTSFSFDIWIQPLEVYSVEDNKVYLLSPDEKISIQFLNKKYYYPLKTVIQEVTGELLDLEFIHPSDIKNLKPGKKLGDVGKGASYDKKIEANLNPNYTFENFVVGANNNYAHAYSLAVAESPAELYNPLFIYGGVGLGKTHLMHSIGNFILDRNPDANIRCVTSEIFTNEVITALRSDNPSAIADFRNKYRNLDVLLVDDIQFIIGKERSQEEFFHTFNTLKELNKQIVISSDKPPKDMSTLEERLKTRFQMGLTVDISSPDFETRMAIIKKKADIEGFDIGDEVFEYIASNIKSNIRDLEGALTKIVAFSRVSKQTVDLDFAKDVLKDIISPDEKKELTIDLIVSVVAEHFDISTADISSKKKSQDIVYPRQIAMYLCRHLTETSLKQIGSVLGKRDHTTVMHAIEKIEKDISSNESTKNTIDILKKKILP